MVNLIELAESGFLPDRMIRYGIRRFLAKRLEGMPADATRATEHLARQLADSPLAVATNSANTQHYEVPVEFFEKVLGPRLKYSSCEFSTPSVSLAEAENAMLSLTCERAEIKDGMSILELGCGWGSLTLWIAERFPNCEITAVSNSASQREFIQSRARSLGLENVRVITADLRDFEILETFDRVVSVEMFEHMRNYRLLFERVSSWLTPSGKAFVHVFCHRNTPYLFETEGASNWMGRHFFTGGTMPSEALFSHFNDNLAIEQQWKVEGLHYWRTCEVWLKNLDQHRAEILTRFREDTGAREAKTSLQRWRIFFMACAELFRYRGGNEWFVAHYLFQHKVAANARRGLASNTKRQPAPAFGA
jgi:cyclopropane-fatty-acyl-phospholipid synthase